LTRLLPSLGQRRTSEDPTWDNPRFSEPAPATNSTTRAVGGKDGTFPANTTTTDIAVKKYCWALVMAMTIDYSDLLSISVKKRKAP
jgi:hypothetical protein